MNYARLGQRIREERLKLNLTQAQLAEAVDISDTYCGQIERGERSLTLDTLVRLVNRLGVTIDYLLMDSVNFTDDNAVNQLRQILDTQSNTRKRMAVDVVRTMFAHLDGEQA
jgi:transcriptional regulator with XRE-family HTH domain